MEKKIAREDVREHILAVSKELFLEKGYLNTSIRDIARAGDLTLGRIYVYFKKKDDIFMALLTPIIDIVEELSVSPKHSEERINEKVENVLSRELFHAAMYRNCNIVKKYKDEFNLAFFKADGFKAMDIREYIVQNYKKNQEAILGLMRQRGIAYLEKDEVLVSTIAYIYISIYEEVLKTDMEGEFYEAYISHMADFLYYGNMGLIGKCEIINDKRLS